MRAFVLGFKDVDTTKINLVGGKGANLAALFNIKEIHVPDGFCITTEAYKKIIEEVTDVNRLLNELSLLKANEHNKIDELGSSIRQLIEEAKVPQNIVDNITHNLFVLGNQAAYAVRSSATAEDLPTASFAGQQDSYLNIKGEQNILKHISKCWASLFTTRAITYRIQNGFDHRKVHLAVIVQKMIFSQVSGILFTADPVTSNRKIVSIDAGFGLGEALVSGLVNADVYKVLDAHITAKKISNKKISIHAVKSGGTQEQQTEPQLQNRQALTDEQIIQLEQTARRIEKHFGVPQDIEWCLFNDTFYIVQSRPITTLYPIPEVNDAEKHVYISVGHQQMMTDPMKPLGISIWQLTAGRPMYEAGGRLFVDVAKQLATVEGRKVLIDVLGKSDPVIKDALETLLNRGDFIQPLQHEDKMQSNQGPSLADYNALNEYDPAIVDDLIRQSEKDIEELKQNIKRKSGSALTDFILKDIQFRKTTAEPKSFGVVMTGMNASSWLNQNMETWLGEKNAADILSQSVPNNITSAMGLDVLDVADAIRPYPEIIQFLQEVKNDNFLDELVNFNGGKAVKDAVNNYLDKYGMRCAGEIDITRTRWSEEPLTLMPLIINNIKTCKAGESKRKFEKGKREALEKEHELITRLEQLPGGEEKAEQTKRMIRLVRNVVGYREYPKYNIIQRYFIYKKALLKEAARLVQTKVLLHAKDIYYLTFRELADAIRTNKVDYKTISRRKENYKLYEKLTPPRIFTSDGEIINGRYKKENLPVNALVGLAVSSGIVEGRARVVLKMEDANLKDEDILVTKFTDPGWTPLFISIKGLVTEVGGLMTHGAVIAREYSLPAVVGVENAISLIKDGQKIRVNGTEGYVEIL